MDKPIETWKCRTTHSACDCVLKRLAAAEACKDVLAHAFSLDYFNEGGSTEAWADKVLKDYGKVINENIQTKP